MQKASETDVAKIGEALGCTPEFVPVLVAGRSVFFFRLIHDCLSCLCGILSIYSCALRGENARQLGWKPAFGLDHLMGTVETEVEFILRHDKK